MLLATITLLVALLAIGGVTAQLFESKVGTLEFRKVPIHYEVAKATWKERLLLRPVDTGSQKALALYYYEGGRRKDLGKLLPLDISPFIEQDLAKQGDELEVDFGDGSNVIARIRPISAEGEKPIEYSIAIHQAGGIDYVDLDEAMERNPEGVVTPVEEKLYYVRVPFDLFPKLDGKALQAKAGSTFSGYSLSYCKISESNFCLMIGLADQTLLATPLLKLASGGKYAQWHGVTAKQVAHFATYRLFDAGPTLAIDSHVQYVVMVPLTEFNRMEPEFVQKHGRLTQWQHKMIDGRYAANFVFEKNDGKTDQITFDLHRCKLNHCIRTDEKAMGVSYIYLYR